MVLVGYSDSEGSDVEETPKAATKPIEKAPAQTKFAVDKANPKKIRVNLTEALPTPSNDREDGEPAAKRPRVGGGAFSGFNAMLPPPKRDNIPAKHTNGSKAPARKVFSLKTGAEPAFSRESDAELRELFSEQGNEDGETQDLGTSIPEDIPKPKSKTGQSEHTSTVGKPFMFKPLSVSRNTKKKKIASHLIPPTKSVTSIPSQHLTAPASSEPDLAPSKPPDPPRKINLFSSGPAELPPDIDESQDDEIVEVLDEDDNLNPTSSLHTHSNPTAAHPQPESLSSIADTLNLTASERRQLLGRNSATSSNKIINFSTDAEYAANQSLIAAGEQIQHNPVRAIAPGKHSLKQLVASAQGQKDALEESFASGRRNKREAGSKYGW